MTDLTAAPFPARLGLVGFGEAGQAFARGWKGEARAPEITAYDIKTEARETAAAKRADYVAAGVSGHDTIGAALEGAEAVFCLVTADQAEAAARAAAEVIAPGTFYFDGNSCAPETKRRAARAITAAGALYIDCAIMAPVHPALHRVPLLLSGAEAEAAAGLAARLGMRAEVVAGPVGRASSVKMLRSVMIKGIEALTLESLLAARRAGVDAEVIASLDASMPGWNWAARAAYNMERTTTHGTRRAAEMREVARTVADLGLAPRMAEATAGWQQDMGALGLDAGPDAHELRADRILAALGRLDSDVDRLTPKTRTGETP